jgi:xanthine dehydrogenase accessory factor
MKRDLLSRLLADRKAKRQVALVTRLDSGAQALVYRDKVAGELLLDTQALATVRDAIRDDKSATVDSAQGRLFVEVFNPPLRLIVVGAVHIAQPLARMAVVAGYDVTVVDPRGAFATADRFPGVTLLTEWPDDALATLDPDRRTAIVTLTHDPKIDDPALETALKSDAFYIGALGSRRTHAGRCERLTGRGYSDAQFARIHGPVGLDIGAVSPAEIAISILGQLTQVLHAEEAG